MLKKSLKLIWRLAIMAGLFIALLIAGVYLGVFGHMYTKEELQDFQNDTASLVLSDDGKIIGKYFDQNRTNIKYQQLPQHLVNALVATEDARYFEHEGVDSRSLLRVLIKSLILQDKSSGGGSTITQQLAKNMYGRKTYGPLTMPINKIKEIILATRLEEVYSKEDILTLYLNTVPFGENVLGIEAASLRYFNKKVKQISIEEAAVLVGILKANTYYNPRMNPEHATLRRNVVLQQMEKYDYLTEEATDSLQSLPLKLDYANLEAEGPANYFLVEVKAEAEKILEELAHQKDTVFNINKDGLIITTTLNYHLQQSALNAFQKHLSNMQKSLNRQYQRGVYKKQLAALAQKEYIKLPKSRQVEGKAVRELFSWSGFYKDSITVQDSIANQLKLLQAGLMAMSPNSGAIKAWVGGIDFRTQPYDQVYAQRQTASAFKPILYLSALLNGSSPCDYLDNDPIVLTDYADWQPQNYDKTTGGNYSIAAALSKSLNIPTVNLFLKVPFSGLLQTWDQLGFSQELLNEPATALGTASASLYEMIQAYSVFANGGSQVKPYMISSIKTKDGEIIYKAPKAELERVIPEYETALLNKMLQKTIQSGTATSIKSTYGVSMPLAGKTGTSQDYADAWFIAYNPNLVIGARVGASFPSIHFNSGALGSGSRLALPLVARTLKAVQNNREFKKNYVKSFSELEDDNFDLFNCEDYVEDGEVTKFLEQIFKKKNTTFEAATKKAEKKAKRKKKPFFKRLFGN